MSEFFWCFSCVFIISMASWNFPICFKYILLLRQLERSFGWPSMRVWYLIQNIAHKWKHLSNPVLQNIKLLFARRWKVPIANPTTFYFPSISYCTYLLYARDQTQILWYLILYFNLSLKKTGLVLSLFNYLLFSRTLSQNQK